ncbi:stalk domain-containing protein [Gorillibacterium sp. sgz500922]|uniref:stalk domain-containing protein n=1 Tax=Gorillibacterium sp. sgz500922 TaxID=3446694 RepID=UPI003F662599
MRHTSHSAREKASRQWTKGSVAAAVLAAALTAAPIAGAATAGAAPAAGAQASNAIQMGGITYEGKPVPLPSKPTVRNGIVMVPARAVFEALGCMVRWNGKEQSFSVAAPSGEELTFYIGKSKVAGNRHTGLLLNSEYIPYLQNHLAWMPLEAVGYFESFQISWTGGQSAAISKAVPAPAYRVVVRSAEEDTSKLNDLSASLDGALQSQTSLTAVPTKDYDNLITLMIAAGDLSDLMQLYHSYRFHDDLLSSVAVDLSGWLDAYPALRAWVKQNPEAARQTGSAVYGIPIPNDPHLAPFPALRADWLNKLGLKQPTTMDELYQVLHEFVYSDPDGNGKNDTVGMTGHTDGDGLGDFAWAEQAFTGSPARFAIVDGKVVDTAVTEGETSALQWLARAYADGLIDREFALLTADQAHDRLAAGKTGLGALTIRDAATLTLDTQRRNPNRFDQWAPLASLRANAQSAAVAPWNVKDVGMYIISKQTDSGKIKQLLAWLEQRITGAGSASAAALGSDAAAADLNQATFGSPKLLPETVRSEAAFAHGLKEDYQRAVDAWSQVTYQGKWLANADALFSRGTYAELNGKLVQMKIKVVMGAASLEEWRTYVTSLKASTEYRAMMDDLQKLADSE